MDNGVLGNVCPIDAVLICFPVIAQHSKGAQKTELLG